MSDIRESPALDIIKLLNQENINFSYNDPMVSSINIDGKLYNSQNIDESNLTIRKIFQFMTGSTYQII